MFTGLVQAVARVASLKASAEGARLELAGLRGAVQTGESVAVNGCCLTVLTRGRYAFDLSPEPLARTNLGRLAPGDPVNIERALRVGDRLGGHFVAGHVDGLARLKASRPQGEGFLWRLTFPRPLAPFIASKGSVALDGVSLTPFAVGRGGFTVALIPHTLKATQLGRRRVGDVLNLEVDLLARYIRRRGARSVDHEDR